MRTILQAVLIIGLVVPVSSEVLKVDFDGKSGIPQRLNNLTGEINPSKAMLSPMSEATANIVLDKEQGNIATKKLFEIKEDGKEEFVQPILTEEGKEVFEFMPNAYRYWEFNCTGQNPNPWGVCWSYTFHPAVAGHNHTSADPHSYSYLDQSTGNPLPTETCKSGIPGNTPYRVYFKAPVFSTLVFDQGDFFGSCSGTLTAESHVTVTAQNLIQLTELTEEPYFLFKPTSQYHPSNRFGTPDTNAKTKKIAWEYYQQFNQKLTVNDMGLAWGGRYHSPPIEENEIPNCWTHGLYHEFHRYGRQTDVRSSNVDTQQKRNCLQELACIYQVDPILHGKAPGSLLGRDVSMLSELELNALDRVEHYHFNFARPTDPPVSPKDHDGRVCSSYLPPEVSVCPKPYTVK